MSEHGVPTEGEGGGVTPPDEVARLTAAVRSLPEEITRSLRAAPLSVKEAKSKWRRRLALAGTIAAAGSGTYAIVSNVTQPNVVSQVAPISRTAARLDNGLGRLDALWARVKADARALRSPATTPGTRRVIPLGRSAQVVLDPAVDPAREAQRALRAWRESSATHP